MKLFRQNLTTHAGYSGALLLASAVVLTGTFGPAVASAAPKTDATSTISFVCHSSKYFIGDDNKVVDNDPGNGHGQGDDHGNGQGNGNGHGLGEGGDNGHGHVGYGGGKKDHDDAAFPHFPKLGDVFGSIFGGFFGHHG